MLKSLRSLAVAALVAALAVGSYAVGVAQHARSAIVSAWEYGVDLARGILAGPVPMAALNAHKPQVLRVQAQAFVGGMLKRERPRVFSTWCMCPSI